MRVYGLCLRLSARHSGVEFLFLSNFMFDLRGDRRFRLAVPHFINASESTRSEVLDHPLHFTQKFGIMTKYFVNISVSRLGIQLHGLLENLTNIAKPLRSDTYLPKARSLASATLH